MSSREVEYEQVRRRIDRLRRRIDRSVLRLTDRTGSWIGERSFVTRYPVRSLAAAVGVGLALSFVVSRFRWPRRIGFRLFEFACQGAWARIWGLLRPSSSHEAEGAEPAGETSHE